MVDVQVLRPPAPADVQLVQRLAREARDHDGFTALADAIWRDLGAPSGASTGFLALVDGRPAGYLHVAASDTAGPEHLVAGLVTAPDARDGTATDALLGALAAEITARGGGRVVLWVTGVDDRLDAVVTGRGFRPFHELLQMRVPLPLAERARWPAGVTVRAFVPGADDADWLAVNNRAFAGHPDQGGWDASTLAPRLDEPWFDADGFLLAHDARGLAGFCWTKVHEPEGGEARLGEIYVIGVDPDRHGTGLGRALTVGGLEYLHDRRGCGTGLLYVDGANAPALGLYRALGFRAHRTDRSYELDVPPR
jgi:mycothiol synthase